LMWRTRGRVIEFLLRVRIGPGWAVTLVTRFKTWLWPRGGDR